MDLSRRPRIRDEIVFFFQAEDGIRGRNVTGVQTCALPISRIAPIKKRARIELKPPPTRAGPAANHTTPRARPMTQPVAVIRLMAANRAGHSLRSEPSIRRTVPAGPLAAPSSPATKLQGSVSDIV